jgi:Bacterial Ig-like domain (group 2)
MLLVCISKRSESFLRNQANSFHPIALLALACALFTCLGCGSGTTPPPRTLVSISVTPASAEANEPTGTLPFTASGTFNQPPTSDDNLAVQWSSSDPTIATVDSQSGMATCVAAGGPVTITASSGQIHGTAQLNCVAESQPGSGNCAYICGSVRCGALTGYCSISTGNACRQVYDPGECPNGKPAGATATDSCGLGIDTSRPCSN